MMIEAHTISNRLIRTQVSPQQLLTTPKLVVTTKQTILLELVQVLLLIQGISSLKNIPILCAQAVQHLVFQFPYQNQRFWALVILERNLSRNNLQEGQDCPKKKRKRK